MAEDSGFNITVSGADPNKRLAMDSGPFGVKLPNFRATTPNKPSVSPSQLPYGLFPTPQPAVTKPPAQARGGMIERADKIAREKATPCHVGAITMAVGGRTDHIPMNVLEGSYVIPADIVSSLGEGNTLAGTKVLDRMFGHGGASTTAGRYKPVPIVAAGGEYVIHPDVVKRLGKRNIDRGHAWFDHFVKGARKHLIQTLSKLPGPKRD